MMNVRVCTKRAFACPHRHTGMCIRCCCFFLPKGNEKIRNTSGKYVCVLWWWWWETATNNNTTSSCRSQQPTDCGTRHAEPNPGSGRSIFFFRSHCGARNVKLEYISVGYSKTRDPTKAVTHTHTNIHTHTIPVALVTILPLGLLSY